MTGSPAPGQGARRPVKIVDVAQEAQVSVATVSRVLNQSAPVAPHLAERVKLAAEKLGYRPNAVARNLRQRGTRVLALIISNINNPFYTALSRGVEERAAQLGYSVLLSNTDEDRVKQDRYLTVAVQEQVAGVILAPHSDESDVSVITSAGIPLVVVDRKLPAPADFVTAASFEGAVMATEHLLREGWQRPACITRPADTETAEQRRLGYEDVMRRHGLKPIVRHVPFHDGSIARLLDQLYHAPEPPDSFLTIDSLLALEVISGLQRRRLRPGSDVGMISFDDAAWALVVEPPLSVVAQPAYEIGAEAVRLLIRRIRNTGPEDPQTSILSTTMIIRGSSLRPRE